LTTSSSYPTSHSLLVLDNHSLIDISRAVLDRSVQAVRRSVDHRGIDRGTDAAFPYAIPFVSVPAQEPQRSRLFTFGRKLARHLPSDNYNDNHHNRIVVISAISAEGERAHARAHRPLSRPFSAARVARTRLSSRYRTPIPPPPAPATRPSSSSICGI